MSNNIRVWVLGLLSWVRENVIKKEGGGKREREGEEIREGKGERAKGEGG